jgi:UDP-glucose 4-epimerase
MRSNGRCVASALVIGANGFLGSHLTDALSAAGHTVTAFDRFSSQEPTFDSTRAIVVRGEFLSRGDLEAAVAGQQLVFHFLSSTNPATAENDPTLDIRTNVAQSVELLEACVAAGTEHVYFASTGGAIYGPQGKSRYREGDHTLPVSPYAIGKLAIENYLRYFLTVHGLKSTSLRISNPYGTRQRPHKRQGLIPIALRQIALGLPVDRFGDGSMIRDYIYVEDLVPMIETLASATPQFDTYNLGSGEGHSITEVLEALRRVTDVDFEVRQKAVPPTFVDRAVLDTSRFRAEFGAVGLTELDEGIKRTYEEIRGQVSG